MENWSSTFTSSQPQFSGEYTCRNTATQNPMSTHLATTTSNCTQRKSRAVRNLQGGVTREGREEGGGGGQRTIFHACLFVARTTIPRSSSCISFAAAISAPCEPTPARALSATRGVAASESGGEGGQGSIACDLRLRDSKAAVELGNREPSHDHRRQPGVSDPAGDRRTDCVGSNKCCSAIGSTVSGQTSAVQ